MFGALFGMQVLSLAFYSAFRDFSATNAGRYVSILVGQVLPLALPASLYLLRVKPQSFSLRKRGLPPGACACLLAAGVVAVFALNIVTVLWSMLLDAVGLPQVGSGVPTPQNQGELWLSLLVVAITPALCEEILFRGLLLPSFERLGTRRAVLISGLLFALMHGQITGLPAHLLLGLGLSVMLVGYGSIWAPMIFHAAFNGTTMLITYVQRDMVDAAESAMEELTALSPVELLASALPILAVAGTAMVLLIYLPMRWAARKNPPPLFEPTGDGLPTAAKVLLWALLGFLLLQYFSNMLLMLPTGGGAA